ncbi:Gfo/Idh/MocA family protein [Nocardiopsis sp. CNT312]|uniref:Gfo/Idh/MocA family protein n=1 Tax=Nocardiopsis sp. CNT312 TaxID=1137268 RepID=UPI00048E23A5|nr:Gfo/Idh/MocA family oxidoreductase [Nocardiopsis sp. CNT312]
MTRRLRVGLVGLGVISRFYLAALRNAPGLELAAVCDRDPDALAAHPLGVPGYTDHRRMLEGAALDALVVTAPNDAHAPICADALDRGVAVCVEKPLALDAAQAAPLTALAGERNTVLFTAFHRRYNSAVARLRRELAGREVAELTVRYLERIEEHAGADTWYLDPRRCGGGCVADNGPNAFDLVEWLLGPAQVVEARVGRDGSGTDRWAEVRLEAGGAAARVLLDWSYPGEVKDAVACTTDGAVLGADMLAGHDGFKASLWHEYTGVLADFEERVRGGRVEDAGGASALRLVGDTYRRAVRPQERNREGAGR